MPCPLKVPVGDDALVWAPEQQQSPAVEKGQIAHAHRAVSSSEKGVMVRSNTRHETWDQ